jgi:hypothetical protein
MVERVHEAKVKDLDYKNLKDTAAASLMWKSTGV